MIQLEVKNPIRWRLVLVIFAAGSLIAACSSSTSREAAVTECTLLDCEDTLSVTLIGNPPPEYTIELVSTNGPTQAVHCVDGQNQPRRRLSTEPMCHQRGATFYKFAPEQLTVNVIWEEGQLSEFRSPTYATEQPNGAGCEPICRTGSVIVSIP